ncbi:hypothetical protein CHKEEEPN_1035 [Methylorubrum podarium]|nr:hypothetical protein CHKEEEPN_1035 [Methylorubrum podarium]
MIAVDRGVELVVRAQRDEVEHVAPIALHVRVHIEPVRRHDEVGLAGIGLPLALAGGERLVQAAGLEQACVEVLELFRVGRLDRVAHPGIVADPGVPIDLRIGRQRRLGELRDDPRLRAHVVADRRGDAPRAVEAGGGILHRHRLRTARLLIDLDAAEAGQDVGDLAADEMRAVELGRDLHGEPDAAPRLLHPPRVGDGADEVAAEPDERPHLAGQHALAGLDGVHPLLAGRLEAVHVLELVERHQRRLVGDADGALALHVGVTAHGADAGAGAADIAAQEQQIDEHLHRLGAAAVLRQPHSVDADHRPGAGVDGGRRLHPLAL